MKLRVYSGPFEEGVLKAVDKSIPTQKRGILRIISPAEPSTAGSLLFQNPLPNSSSSSWISSIDLQVLGASRSFYSPSFSRILSIL